MKIALESTLITHGFAHPKNIEVALLLEDAARSLGCQPQTIAVLDGQIRVGLTEPEIRDLANRGEVTKAGVRELPLVLASKGTASTTVSATMRIAFNCGIPVFATGGIGGVHPGEWDVSQDILELSRTPMIVVSAGPKAILNLRGTHEMLETYGVTVVGYQTDEMPAFYSRSAGIPIARVDSPREIVQIYKAAQELKLPGAVLVFNPIPPDYEIPESQVEAWRDQSLADLRTEGVSGKGVTPFLLSKMAEHSQGKTVVSNIQLLKNNVILGSQIALEFERMAP